METLYGHHSINKSRHHWIYADKHTHSHPHQWPVPLEKLSFGHRSQHYFLLSSESFSFLSSETLKSPLSSVTLNTNSDIVPNDTINVDGPLILGGWLSV